MNQSTTAQHTPGPWQVDDSPQSTEVVTPDGITVAQAIDPTVRGRSLLSWDEVQANRRLIAAAPAMAETLLWIREHLHPNALGRSATYVEALAIGLATKVLREAGVIPTPVLEPVAEPEPESTPTPRRGRPRTRTPKTYMTIDGDIVER